MKSGKFWFERFATKIYVVAVAITTLNPFFLGKIIAALVFFAGLLQMFGLVFWAIVCVFQCRHNQAFLARFANFTVRINTVPFIFRGALRGDYSATVALTAVEFNGSTFRLAKIRTKA